MPSLARHERNAWRWLALLVVGMPASTLLLAQSLVNNASLSFGSFVAGSGGTVTVSPGGSRTKSGGVLLFGQGGAAAAAQFTVTGTPDASYALTLPADNTVSLANGDLQTMTLNGFVSSPSGNGTLSSGGTRLISIGATLVVAAGQATGAYAGSFSVTVNYP